MMQGQKVPALMAALLGEGVTAQQIETAVAAVRSHRLGTAITSLASPTAGDPSMVRAFIFEQADRLERS